jgi:two-component system cell cycle sensor histidine kinase/response regulator CckA
MARTSDKATILVVDDKVPLRGLLVQQLRSEGYKVVEAGYGMDALTAARSSPEPIDLVLRDIVMPAMLETEPAQRLLAEHPRIRVMLVSAHEPAAASGRPGDGPVLPKSFDGRTMLALIETVLNPTSSATGTSPAGLP